MSISNSVRALVVQYWYLKYYMIINISRPNSDVGGLTGLGLFSWEAQRALSLPGTFTTFLLSLLWPQFAIREHARKSGPRLLQASRQSGRAREANNNMKSLTALKAFKQATHHPRPLSNTPKHHAKDIGSKTLQQNDSSSVQYHYQAHHDDCIPSHFPRQKAHNILILTLRLILL